MEMFSGKCRKHPSSNKQPGICSLCLRDRLLQLADAYNRNTITADVDRCVSFSSTPSSSYTPIYSLPMAGNKKKHVRNASDVMVRSISYVIGGGGELKKSRSIVEATMAVEVSRSGTKGGKSFWEKLLKIRGNGAGKDQVVVLGKSRTLKDRLDV